MIEGINMNTKTKPVEIYGRTYEPRVGSYIELDGNRIGKCLLGGESYADWHCDFRWPTLASGWDSKFTVACNVTITGRTLRLRGGDCWLRVRIEWVQDGEPNTTCGGWMRADERCTI